MQHTWTRPRRPTVFLLGSVTLAASLAGCGGGGGGSKAEEHKTPTQVLADAKSALFNAKAVHAVGSLADSGGTEQLDLQLQGQDIAGSITDAGQKLQIVKVSGTVYLNAPAAFWTKSIGRQGAALAGKWLKLSGDEADQFSELTIQGLAADLNADDSPLTGTTAKSTVDGRKALLLTQKDGSQLFVDDSTAPVPLKAVNHGSDQGTITFSDYGTVRKITPPAGAVSPQQAVGGTGTGTSTT